MYSNGAQKFDLGLKDTELLFSKSGVFRRKCCTCAPSHQTIFYKRLTPLLPGMTVTSLMKQTWTSFGNILNVDFKLYSSYADLKADKNAWKFCNYDVPGVAGFRECGPIKAVPFQWNSIDAHLINALKATNKPSGLNVTYAVLESDRFLVVKPKELALVPGIPNVFPQASPWLPVYTNNNLAKIDLGQTATDIEFLKSGIFKRECANCLPDHTTIFYKRITPVPANVSVYSLMKTTRAQKGNLLNKDFKLYSTLEDLLRDRNSWTYCSYDQHGVGSFRECGPKGSAHNQWNSANHPNDRSVTFSVMKADPLNPRALLPHEEASQIPKNLLTGRSSTPTSPDLLLIWAMWSATLLSLSRTSS